MRATPRTRPRSSAQLRAAPRSSAQLRRQARATQTRHLDEPVIESIYLLQHSLYVGTSMSFPPRAIRAWARSILRLIFREMFLISLLWLWQASARSSPQGPFAQISKKWMLIY